MGWSREWTIFLLAVGALLGAVLGTVAGMPAALLLKNGLGGLIWDALIGLVGFWLAFQARILIPIGPNTIHYNLPGGVIVTSTMNTYQYPNAVAYVVSLLLPVGHEVIRWKRKAVP